MTQIEPPAARDFQPTSGFYMLFIDGGRTAGLPHETTVQGSIGVVLKDPKGKDVPGATISRALPDIESHNVAEYEALITGLELALAHNIEYIAVFSDSRTVVNQVNDLWGHSTQHLESLCGKAQGLLNQFRGTQVSWVPRTLNKEAHALAEEGKSAHTPPAL